jgi:hypothetical protein
MSRFISKGAFGETCEAAVEKDCGEGFGTSLKGGLVEALRGASGGASRTAPQALQVAWGSCINPHVEHFKPYIIGLYLLPSTCKSLLKPLLRPCNEKQF